MLTLALIIKLDAYKQTNISPSSFVVFLYLTKQHAEFQHMYFEYNTAHVEVDSIVSIKQQAWMKRDAN